MGFIEKLDYLMANKKMNKNMLSRETGIPYTTIDGFYKKGTDNIKLSTLKKIADYFNVSIDYLADDDRPIEQEEVYYINEDAAEYAQELLNNKELRLLFDATKDVSKEDLQLVVEMVKKFKRD